MRLFRRSDSSDEAKTALADAKHNLRKVQARSSEVSRVAKALKEIRERNHFAEQLEEIIRSGGLYPNDT